MSKDSNQDIGSLKITECEDSVIITLTKDNGTILSAELWIDKMEFNKILIGPQPPSERPCGSDGFSISIEDFQALSQHFGSAYEKLAFRNINRMIGRAVKKTNGGAIG